MNNMDVESTLKLAQQLPLEKEVEFLRDLVRQQAQMIEALEAAFTKKMAEYEEEIRALKKLVYGQKSEKRKPKDQEEDEPEPASPTPPKQPNRGKASTQRNGNHQTDKGLRFTAAAEKNGH